MKDIIAFDSKEIIYVSCNPATLARDLALFTKEKYDVRFVQPVDMFAQSHHVEAVVLMYFNGKR